MMHLNEGPLVMVTSAKHMIEDGGVKSFVVETCEATQCQERQR